MLIVVNVNLLRDVDDRKLINAYAKFMYNDEKDTEDDIRIKENLVELLDWDKNGDNGLGIFCSKFEQIKDKDWATLINFIKENKHEIKSLSYGIVKARKLESIKIVNDVIEAKKQHNIERFTDKNYKVSGRGKKAKPCEYKGVIYKSRQECEYKTGISRYKLYKYLKETGQE